MKKLFVLFLFIASSTILSGMDAGVTYARFKGPDQSFIEIYIHIAGNTVTYVPVDSIYSQASVDIGIIFRAGEEVIKYDRVQLNSPLSNRPIDFMDLKRYALEDGVYELEVILQDQADPENTQTFVLPVEMNFSAPGLHQSDIQLLSSFEPTDEVNAFTRNGYFLEPLPHNFYGKYADRLMFYHEIYNSDAVLGEDFVVSYSIERVLGTGESETLLIGHKRKHPQAVNVLLLHLDITQLASGNYRLAVEVRNRTQELISRQAVDFTRANPFLNAGDEDIAQEGLEDEFVSRLDAEELEYSLRAIAMKVDATDGILLNELLRQKDPDAMRLYLFSYWVKENPNRPDLAYYEYMALARAVDETFYSGLGHGFESDRGYVYLKYGKPDDIVTEMNDPVAPPYEVWSYYAFPATNQNNVKFIFYNPSLASGDYRLLHSNAYGEVTNPNWQNLLYQDANQNPYDNGARNPTGTDGFGRRLDSNITDW